MYMNGIFYTYNVYTFCVTIACMIYHPIV